MENDEFDDELKELIKEVEQYGQQEKLERQKKEQEIQELKQEIQNIKVMLESNIGEANEALINALKNTDTQINQNQTFSKLLTWFAVFLIILDIAFVLTIPFLIIAGSLNDLLDKTGIWAILFFTFPALLILLIALSLLRHQKQLIAEIRHYSMLKHKIELYGGILTAAQYMANNVIELKNSDNEKSAEYIQKVFDEIKTELLKSPNFDLNSQPHIFPEEGGNIVEILKSTMELVKTSTETSKAVIESAQKAVSSNK